jgi:hypothetical protein
MTLTSPALSAAEKVGIINFARGTVAAHNESTEPRLLSKDSEVFVGDNIQTSHQSFAIIAFDDGSKVTVRPESSFTVNEFSHSQEAPSAKMTLHEGGVRTSSGVIANANPDNFQITTPHTVVKAQQADFSVRVCKGDACEQEENKIEKEDNDVKHDVIARVVELRGQITAVSETDLTQKPRLLTLGAPLYAQDKVTSELGAYAVLVFKDQGRVTLDQSSTFAIKSYQFENNAQDNAAYDLVVGGMRVITGLISKDNKEAFTHTTPVATIGIRGTGYKTYMQEKLHVDVWQGTINLSNNFGALDVGLKAASRFALVKNIKTAPESIKALPTDVESTFNGPQPDQVEVENEPELFSYTDLDGTDEGTYVDVHEGHVKVKDGDDEFTDLGRNESAYTNPEGKTVRTDLAPKFMQHDPYPLPSEEFDENLAEITTFSLLADNMTVHENGALFCECK